MNGDVVLAGFTLTAEEWRGLDAETRDELLGAVAGVVELYSAGDDDARGPLLLP